MAFKTIDLPQGVGIPPSASRLKKTTTIGWDMKQALAALAATEKTTEARSGLVFELDSRTTQIHIEFDSLN